MKITSPTQQTYGQQHLDSHGTDTGWQPVLNAQSVSTSRQIITKHQRLPLEHAGYSCSVLNRAQHK